MSDANEMYDTIMRELNNVVISDTDKAKEEQEGFSFHVEAVSIVSCWGLYTEKYELVS